MKKLTWLHISDIHFLPKNNWRDSPAKDSLLSYLSEMFIEEPSLKPDFIFCTGDIAYGQLTGSPIKSQYEDAKLFFDRLLQCCGDSDQPLPKSRLFLVPGNHDVNRSSVGELMQSTLKTWAGDSRSHVSKINQMFDKKTPEITQALERLKEYGEFIFEYVPEIVDENGRYCYVNIVEIDGIRIGIAGFNSAWSCSGDEDNRTIWIPSEWQFNEAKLKLKDADIKIGLIHHPSDWFNDSDQTIAQSRIATDFHFWLHGHIHDAWVVPAQTFVEISAGAVGAEATSEFGVNIVQLDLASRKGVAHLHSYDRRYADWAIKPIPVLAKNAKWEFFFPDNLQLEDGAETEQLNPSENQEPEVEQAATLTLSTLIQVNESELTQVEESTSDVGKDVSYSDVLRGRDINLLKRVLETIHRPTMARVLERASVDRVHYDGFYFWEGFNALMSSFQIHFYDKGLERVTKAFHESWGDYMHLSGTVFFPTGPKTFALKPDFEWNDIYRQSVKRLHEAYARFSTSFQDFLEYVFANYFEIDLMETDAQAWKEFVEYEAENEHPLEQEEPVKLKPLTFENIKEFLIAQFPGHQTPPDSNILNVMSYLKELGYNTIESIEEDVNQSLKSYLQFETELSKPGTNIVALLGTLAYKAPDKLSMYYPYTPELKKYLEKSRELDEEFAIRLSNLTPYFKYNIKSKHDELVISPVINNVGTKRITNLEVQGEISGPYKLVQDYMFHVPRPDLVQDDGTIITISENGTVFHWEKTVNNKLNAGQIKPLNLGNLVFRATSDLKENLKIKLNFYITESDTPIKDEIVISSSIIPDISKIRYPDFRITREGGSLSTGNLKVDIRNPIYTNDDPLRLSLDGCKVTHLDEFKTELLNVFCDQNQSHIDRGLSHPIKPLLFLRKTLISSIFDKRIFGESDLDIRADFFDFYEGGIEVVRNGNYSFAFDQNGNWQLIYPIIHDDDLKEALSEYDIYNGFIIGRIPFKLIYDYNLDGDDYNQATLFTADYKSIRGLFEEDVFSILEFRDEEPYYKRLSKEMQKELIPIKLDKDYMLIE